MSRSTVLISYMPVVDPNWGCGSFQRFTVQEEDMHRSWNILKLLPFGDQHSWLWCNMTIDFNLWWKKWIWQPEIQINGEASANVSMSPTGTSLCGRVCVCVCLFTSISHAAAANHIIFWFLRVQGPLVVAMTHTFLKRYYIGFFTALCTACWLLCITVNVWLGATRTLTSLFV